MRGARRPTAAWILLAALGAAPATAGDPPAEQLRAWVERRGLRQASFTWRAASGAERHGAIARTPDGRFRLRLDGEPPELWGCDGARFYARVGDEPPEVAYLPPGADPRLLAADLGPAAARAVFWRDPWAVVAFAAGWADLDLEPGPDGAATVAASFPDGPPPAFVHLFAPGSTPTVRIDLDAAGDVVRVDAGEVGVAEAGVLALAPLDPRRAPGDPTTAPAAVRAAAAGFDAGGAWDEWLAARALVRPPFRARRAATHLVDAATAYRRRVPGVATALAPLVGGRLVAGTDRGWVVVLEADTGRALVALRHADGEAGVRAVAASRDGGRVAALGGAGTIVCWDVAREREVARLGVGGERLEGLALAADGGWVAAASAGAAAVRRWTLPDGGVTRLETAGPVRRLAAGPAGDLLATSGLEGPIEVWEGDGRVAALEPPGGERIAGLAFGPEGRLFAGALRGAVRVWSIPGAEPERTLAPRARALAGLVVSADGARLATAHPGGRVVVREAASGEVVGERSAGTGAGPAPALALAPDGAWVAWPGPDNAVVVWDLSRERTPGVRDDRPVDVAIAPSGETVAYVRGAHLTCWRPRRPGQTSPGSWSTSFPPGGVGAGAPGRVGFLADGRLAAAAAGAVLYRPDSWRPRGALGDLPAAALDVGGPRLLLVGADAQAVVAVADGAPVGAHALAGRRFALAPDGRRLVAARAGSLSVVDAASGAEAGGAASVTDPRALAFAPDGAALAVAGAGAVRVHPWPLDGGEPRAIRLAGAEDVAWSGDGELLAVAGPAAVHVYRGGEEVERIDLRPSCDAPLRLDWSGGRELAVLTARGAALVFEVGEP